MFIVHINTTVHTTHGVITIHSHSQRVGARSKDNSTVGGLGIVGPGNGTVVVPATIELAAEHVVTASRKPTMLEPVSVNVSVCKCKYN